MPQTSLAEWVEALDRVGLLTRLKDEKRVDELPALMDENPDTAIFVEKVKDCSFPYLANAYGVRPMYALALGCDIKRVGVEIAERSSLRQKPQVVGTAPCKDVILKGDDVDLTIFPLFHHHPHDGHAYLNDTNVVSRDPNTGLIDQGIYRFMYRSKNETNIDMRNDTYGARIHAKRYQQLGKDMPIAVVIGGPGHFAPRGRRNPIWIQCLHGLVCRVRSSASRLQSVGRLGSPRLGHRGESLRSSRRTSASGWRCP
jgi:UbiD family decarboxylase